MLGLLDDLAENDKEKYAKFWGEFGRVLKEGVGEDFANKDKIAGLLRFASTHADTDGGDRFAGGLHRAHEGRPGQDLLRHRRHLQRREEQPAPGSVPQEGHRSAAAVRPRGRVGGVQPDRVRRQEAGVRRQGRPRPGQAGRRGREAGAGKGSRRIQGPDRQDQGQPGRTVKEVRVTHRLTDSPACLVADEHDMSGNLARMLKAAGQKAPNSQPILEINPKHPVVLRLKNEEAALRRLGRGAVRPGPAGRRRAARRPGELCQARESADAGDERLSGLKVNGWKETGILGCPFLFEST